jgi:autotransporter-associated beta strand protein
VIAAAAATAMLGTVSSGALATTTLYWGGGTSTVSNGTPPAGGSGSWDLSTINWSQDPTLGTTYQTWPTSGTLYTANFANTAGTVTIDGTGIQANALNFTTTGYTIAGSSADNLALVGFTPKITTGSAITSTINAPIAGAFGFTEAGGGTLALGGSNTYFGSTIVTGSSTLLLNNANAVQNSTLSEATGLGSLSFASGIGTVNVGGLSWADNITLSDLGSNAVNLSVGGDNASTTYAGILTGGSLTKVGAGQLTLSNTGAQGVGSITLGNGYLNVLGSSLGSGTLTLGGGTLIVSSATGNTYNNAVTVTGNSLIMLNRGVAGAGVTQTFGNLTLSAPLLDIEANSFTTSGTAGLTFGNVTLTSATTLLVDGSTSAPNTVATAVNTGSITGNDNFTVATQTGATVTVNGSVGTLGDTSTLNKYGPGTLTIAAGNALNSSGQVNVTGGTLTLAGATTALNVSNFVVNGGATFHVGSDDATQGGQLAASTYTAGSAAGNGTFSGGANITLNGGTLYGAYPSTTSFITPLATLNIGPGESTFTGSSSNSNSSGTQVFQFSSLNRQTGGVLSISSGTGNNFPPPSTVLFFGNASAFIGNGGSFPNTTANNPYNPAMTNGVIPGVLFNNDFATVNTAPIAFGVSGNGTFPTQTPSGITSLDYNGPSNNYGFYNGDLSLSEVGQPLGTGSSIFAVPNDGTASILEELSGTITLTGNTKANVINISPNSAPPSYVTDSTYASQDGGVATPGPLVYNLAGNTLTLTTGGLLASTIDGANGNSYPIRIVNGTLTSSSSELFILNSSSNSTWGIGAAITGAISLVHGGNSTSSGAQVYLSGENTYTGQTYLDSPNAVNILTERQLGAQPSALVTNAITMSNGSTLTFPNNVPATLSPLRGITLNGGNSTIMVGTYSNVPANTAADWVLASPITGNGGITLADSNFSAVIVSGANTYDGQTAAGGGNYVLDFESINNIGSGTPSSFGSPTNAYNGRITFASSNNNSTFNYVGVGNASTDREFDLLDTTSQGISATGTGSLTLNGNLLAVNGGGTSNAGVTLAGSGVGVLNGDIVSSLTGGSVTFKLSIGGNVLNMWTLNGSNDFDGVLAIQASGTTQFTTVGTVGSGPSSLGAPSTVANGTIALGAGVLRFIGSTSQTTDRVITAGGGSLEASGTNGANLTWNGPVTDSSTLVLAGTGTGNLTGAVTGSAGLTKSGQGTWTINPSTAELYTGATTVNGGTLVLDSSNLATPINLLAPTSTVLLGGGNLSLLAKSTGSTSQTFGTFGTNTSTGSQVTLNSNGGSGLSMTTGNWSRGGGSTLNIAETGTVTLTTGTIAVTNANGLLPWVTINGADFAQAAGTITSNVAAGGALSVFTAYTGALPTTGGANANAYNLSGGQTQTASVPFSALKITGSGTLSTGTFSLGSGNPNPVAILYDGTGGNSYTISATTGALGSNGVELDTLVNNGTLTIGASLGTGSGLVDKGGNGTLILSGNNTNPGRTNVEMGTLQAGSTTGLSPFSTLSIDLSGTQSGLGAGNAGGLTTASVVLAGFSNGVADLTGNGILSNSSATPATLTIGANAPLQSGLTATFTGLLQDGTGGGALSIVKAGTGEEVLTGSVGNATTGWNDSYSGSLTIADGNLDSPFINMVGTNGPLGTSSTAIIMGSTSHTGILGYSGPNGLTNRNFTVASNGGAGFDLTSDSGGITGVAQTLFASTLNLTGSISGSGPILKLGSGNLLLSGSNTAYTGNFIVTGGLLQFANNTTAVGGSTITLRDGGVVSVTSAATDLTGGMSQAFLNRVTVAADSIGVVALGANSNSNLNFNSPNLANANLGATIPVTYTGTLTPYGNTYKIGGGGPQSSITLPNADELTGANNLVVNPGGSSNNTATSPATVVLGDAQNYTGSTTISGGNSLTVQGNGTGAVATTGSASLTLAGANANIASTSGVTINNGGILRFIESPGDVSKLGSAPVTLNGGSLEQDTDGSSQWSLAQTISSVALNRGASTVYVMNSSSGSYNNTLTISSLTRNPGATLNIGNALNATTEEVVLSSAPTLPAAWLFVNSADYATMSGSNVVALNAAFTTNDSTWNSPTLDTAFNASSGTTLTLSANDSLHTLRVTAAFNMSFGAHTLAINGILAAAGAPIIGVPADTGSVTAPAGGGELDIAALGSSVTILENIANPTSGTTTLVVSGTKGVTLGNATAPSVASTYTGGIVLNQGTLTVANINSLPASSAGITINGGLLDVTGGTANGLSGGTVWSNPVTVNADAAFLNTTANNYAGTLTLANGANLFLQANGSSSTADMFSGNIAGTGNLYYMGSGGVVRTISGTSSNTYTGSTYLYGDESNSTPGGVTIVFAKTGGAVAIPGDLYLGRTTESGSTLSGSPEKAVMGANSDQFGPSTTIYFAGGHGNDAGDLQIAGTTAQVVIGLQSLMPGDGLIENANASSGTLTVNVPTGVTRTFSGAIVNTGNNTGAGTLGLNFSGLGTQVISGVNNTYSGATNISSGTVRAGTVNALSPNSAVNVTGGTLDVSGYANTVASLIVGTGGTLALGYGNVLTDTGAATLTGNLTISGTPGSLPETLITYASGMETGTFTGYTPPVGDKLVYSAAALLLEANGPASLTWDNAGALSTPTDGATWDTANYNWNNGSGVVTYNNTSNGSSGDIVTFNDTNNGHYSVNISGTVSPSSTTFNNSLGNYTVTGINSSSGIAGPGSLTKFGTGSVTLSSSNSYTGGTNVNAGTLILASANAFPANTSLNISSGAQVTIANHSSNATYVPTLSSLSNSGTIDVTNNAMVIHNGSIGAISAEIASAYSNGTWTGTSGTSGVITSSVAATDTNHLTAVGVATGLTSFEGSTVLATDVLVKYTYYGDTNLDGHVDGTDYSRIDNGYLNQLTGWDNGDFNYDGVIDGSDYTLIDNSYNTQGANLSAQVGSATAQIAGVSSVPEPTTLGLLGIGAVGLLGRRSRNRRH